MPETGTPEQDCSLGIGSEPKREASGCLARTALAASPASLVGIWALAAALWPGLPERIPGHFDGAGRPDRRVPRTFASWFTLPMVSAVMTVLMVAISLSVRGMARRRPGIMNTPGKRDFLRLPPDARLRALGPMDAFLGGLATLAAGEIAPAPATEDTPPGGEPGSAGGDPESEIPKRKTVDARRRRAVRRGTAFDVERGSAPPGGGACLPAPEELRPRV